MRVRLAPIGTCLIAAACSSDRAGSDAIYASIRRCGLEGHMRVEAEGQSRFRITYLNRNADYDKVDCFIAEARRLRLDLGFIGNEALATE